MKILILLTLLLVLPATVNAQRPQRREFLEDLLKSLIESQIDPHENERPGFAPRENTPVSPEIRDTRVALAGFNSEMNLLVQGLYAEQQSEPQLRAHLGDAVRLQANSNVLLQNANRYNDPRILVNDFQVVDQQWRVLSHRLKQVPGISNKCIASISQIQKYNDQLCGYLHVEPQINRAELMRLTTQLNSEFQHLLQNIYYSHQSAGYRQTDHRTNDLYREGQLVYARISQATSLIDRGSYESIVAAYKQSTSDWRAYALKLRTIENERIRSDVRHIEEIGRAIHEQLWLPIELDINYVVHLTQSVETDAGTLFETMSVIDLLQCENPNQVLNTVREFLRQCGAFSISLKSPGGEIDLEELNWSFNLFDLRWRTLYRSCADVQRPEIRRRLDNIHDTMNSLKELVGGPAIDHNALLQIAAKLDQLSLELESDVLQNVLRNSSYDRAFNDNLRQKTEALHHAVHDFHDDLISVRNQDHAVEHLPEIFDNWLAIKHLVVDCTDPHRQAFGKHRREIEPLIVKLQIVFAE